MQGILEAKGRTRAAILFRRSRRTLYRSEQLRHDSYAEIVDIMHLPNLILLRINPVHEHFELTTLSTDGQKERAEKSQLVT
jgi:hypothetical protein